jgi:hypothetical protein
MCSKSVPAATSRLRRGPSALQRELGELVAGMLGKGAVLVDIASVVSLATRAPSR